MDNLDQVLNLKSSLRKARRCNEKLAYDLARADYLLGECIILMNKIGSRAESSKDSFTAMWCETMVSDIRKTLDQPRFGVDIITMKQVRDTK